MKPPVFLFAGARAYVARQWRKLTSNTRSVFKGAELSRLWFDWVATPISADQEIYNDFLRLRSRAREMRRNHPLVRQYADLISTNVIGDEGMRLRAKVRNRDGKLNKDVNDRIEAAWEDWSENVTTDTTMGLTDFSHMLVESLAVDGEILIRKIKGYKANKYRFALQAVDPDLLDHQYFRAPTDTENEVRLGVEVDNYGRPVAFHLWDRHPTDLFNSQARKRIRVPAEEILHIYRPDRPNTSRGTTWLNSIMMPAKMLDGYVEAEVVAARTGAAKMGFFEQKTAGDYAPPADGERLTMEAVPGQFEALPPGMEFKPWSPEHPSTAFPNFVQSMQRWIASGMHVSYNVLANDLQGVNYSSLRSALLTERDHWRKLQKWWARRVLKPIYAEWLGFAQLAGLYLDSRDWNAYMAVRFMPRGWSWVDPLKDINASVAGIENGLASRARVLADQGQDFEEIAEELADEQALIAELKLQLTGFGVGPGATAGDAPKNDQVGSDSTANDGGGRAARLRLVRSLLTLQE
jgi:lambda family phage portal protein